MPYYFALPFDCLGNKERCALIDILSFYSVRVGYGVYM